MSNLLVGFSTGAGSSALDDALGGELIDVLNCGAGRCRSSSDALCKLVIGVFAHVPSIVSVQSQTSLTDPESVATEIDRYASFSVMRHKLRAEALPA